MVCEGFGLIFLGFGGMIRSMSALERWFDSVETGRPFRDCLVCREPLRASDSWVVNKHFHRGECVMEYAVCDACRDVTSKELSEESKAAFRDFIENGIDWEQRILDWMALSDPVGRLDGCVSCLLGREGLKGFVISAKFGNRGELIERAQPFLMCEDCVQAMTRNISEGSRQLWQDFIDRYFEGPDHDSIRNDPFF